MKMIAAAALLALPTMAAAQVDNCPEIRGSIEADFEAATERAARAGQRRMNLFAMSSRADEQSAISQAAEAAGEEMAEILAEAEKARRLGHKRIDGICSR
jgi:hypothetical protein